MKNKLIRLADIVCNPFWFTLVTMIYLPINMITVINVQFITRIILGILCVWGALVLTKIYLFSGKKPYSRQMLVLIAFLAVCLITALINFKYGGFGQIEKLYFSAISILILFTQFGLSADERKKELYILSHTIPVITTIAFLVSIWMYLSIFVMDLKVRSGVVIHVGFAENRLIGVFSSPNVGGTYAIFSMVLCIIAFFMRKKNGKSSVWFNILYGFQIVVSIIFISLALSKGTYVNLFFLIALLSIFWPGKKFNWLGLFKRILCAALACGFIFAGTFGIQKAMAYGMLQINKDFLGEGSLEGDLNDAYNEIIKRAQLGWDGRVEAGRTDIDITNKRSGIWLGTLHMLKGKNLFTGVNNSVLYLEDNEAVLNLNADDTMYVNWSQSNTHNGYLQVFMQAGIFALLLILGFVIYKMLHLLIAVCKQRTITKDNENNKFVLIICVVLFSLLVMILENNMYESNFIMMGTNYFQAIFWYSLGLCDFLLEKTKNGEEIW